MPKSESKHFKKWRSSKTQNKQECQRVVKDYFVACSPFCPKAWCDHPLNQISVGLCVWQDDNNLIIIIIIVLLIDKPLLFFWKATDLTLLVCPEKRRTLFWAWTSHKASVWSPLAVTKLFSPGIQSRSNTALEWACQSDNEVKNSRWNVVA